MAENSGSSSSSSSSASGSDKSAKKATTVTHDKVLLAVTGMPNMVSFTTSSGLVIDRAGVVVDGSDVEAIKTEASRLGVQLTEAGHVESDEEAKK